MTSGAETLGEERLRKLLQPYLGPLSPLDRAGQCDSDADPLRDEVLRGLQSYLEVLLRWNDRTNLTAIRDPETIVQRHFGESLFLARHLRPLLREGARVLDFGSGAGFPGLPLQLLYPELQVTLAESQGKKAAFLREASRVLGLHCEVWSARVEQMPAAQRFEAVAMRAVDDPDRATRTAWEHVSANGLLCVLSGKYPQQQAGGQQRVCRVPIPNSAGQLEILTSSVPRGTQVDEAE